MPCLMFRISRTKLIPLSAGLHSDGLYDELYFPISVYILGGGFDSLQERKLWRPNESTCMGVEVLNSDRKTTAYVRDTILYYSSPNVTS